MVDNPLVAQVKGLGEVGREFPAPSPEASCSVNRSRAVAERRQAAGRFIHGLEHRVIVVGKDAIHTTHLRRVDHLFVAQHPSSLVQNPKRLVQHPSFLE